MVYKIDHERYKSYKFSISIEIMQQTDSYQKYRITFQYLKQGMLSPKVYNLLCL